MSAATTAATTRADPNNRRPSRTRNSALIVVYLSLGGLAFSVLQSRVAPALATIGTDLGASTTDVTWILTAYLLSASVLTPILGRLGDMVGKRRILIVALALLLLGTVLAARAPALGVLIAARVLQGAAGAIMPLSIGIARDVLPPERIGVTIGLLLAIFGVGGGIGIVAAGPIVQSLNWHWLFWLPAALIIIALSGALFGIPESPVRRPGRLDVLGSVIASVALISILLAVSDGPKWGWGSALTLSVFTLGAIALVVFVLVELRVRQSLVYLRLFKIRGVWTAHVVSLIVSFAMFGVFVLIPPLLELPAGTAYGFGTTVTEAGLLPLPIVIAMVALGPVGGMLVRTRGGEAAALRTRTTPGYGSASGGIDAGVEQRADGGAGQPAEDAEAADVRARGIRPATPAPATPCLMLHRECGRAMSHPVFVHSAWQAGISWCTEPEHRWRRFALRLANRYHRCHGHQSG